MNELPKIVFSRTLKSATWSGARIAAGELAAAVADLRREEGKPLFRAPADWKQLEARAFPAGAVLLKFGRTTGG